jgi:hypothetical protein
MSKQGILITVAGDQEGATPQIVTPLERFPVDDMGNDVARGKVPGAEPIGAFGYREASAGETNRVIWPNGVFTLPPVTGVQMSIVSTSANDGITGSHAQKLELHYLDDDLNPQIEFIETDGLTPVLTTATNIRFINCLHIHQIGTVAAAAGDITASNGGTDYAEIAQGEVRCTSSARMIPKGKVCYVKGIVGGAVSGTAAAKVIMKMVASELDAFQYIDPLILFPYAGVAVQDTSETFVLPIPLRFSAGSVVALTLTSDKVAIVTGSWFGWLEDVK